MKKHKLSFENLETRNLMAGLPTDVYFSEPDTELPPAEFAPNQVQLAQAKSAANSSQPTEMLVKIDVDSIKVIDEADGPFSDAEPYMWPVFFKIDAVALEQPNNPSAWTHGPNGSHRNLGGNYSYGPGDNIRVPAKLGEWSTQLVSNSRIPLNKTMVGAVVVLLEEDSAPSRYDIDHKYYPEFVRLVQAELQNVLRSPELLDALSSGKISTSLLEAKVQQELSSKLGGSKFLDIFSFGFANVDDFIGAGVFLWNQEQLANAKGSGIPFMRIWNEATGSQDGHYQLSGRVWGEIDLDDQIAEARKAKVGERVVGSIGRTGGDVDMIAFSARAGQRVGFDVDRWISNLDSHLRLFDAQGRELARNNNAAAVGERVGKDSYLEYKFEKTGTYYLGISANGNSQYNPLSGSNDRTAPTSGSYSLQLIDLGPADGSDQLFESKFVWVGQSVSEKIGFAADVDMYRIYVGAGQRLSFDIDHAKGSRLDSYLRLFDSLGREIAHNNNGAAFGEKSGRDAHLSHTFSTSGVYYVGISAYGNSSYNAITGGDDHPGLTTGGYSLNIVNMGPVDVDDQIAEARVAKVGERVVGSIGRTGGDVNMIAFSARAGQRVGFDVDRWISNLDSHLRLFDAQGRELARNNNAAAVGERVGKDSYLEYKFEKTGTYYLGISANGNSQYNPLSGSNDRTAPTSGSYSLQLIDLGPVDGSDQLFESKFVWVGQSVSEKIGFAADVDMYRIYVGAGQRLSFDIDHAKGSRLDSYLRLFDSQGREIAHNNNGAASGEKLGREAYLSHTFSTGGVYYVGISAYGNSSYNAVTGGDDRSGKSTGGYTLKIDGNGLWGWPFGR